MYHKIHRQSKLQTQYTKVEPIEIWKTLNRSLRIGWSMISILSDAKLMVQILQKKEDNNIVKNRYHLWNICRSMNFFKDINILYIPRTRYVLTHNLTQFTISLLHRIFQNSTFSIWVVNDAFMSYEHLK